MILYMNGIFRSIYGHQAYSIVQIEIKKKLQK